MRIIVLDNVKTEDAQNFLKSLFLLPYGKDIIYYNDYVDRHVCFCLALNRISPKNRPSLMLCPETTQIPTCVHAIAGFSVNLT